MDSNSLKLKCWEIIDSRADWLVNISKHILQNPEPGFHEFETSKFVSQKLQELGLPHQKGIALTGIKGIIDGGLPGPTIAIIGELDSLRVAGHSHANPETDAAHACGHHCQIGMMLGVVAAFQEIAKSSKIPGKLAFMALPAEEFIDVEYRYGLHKEGHIEFMSGKQEFLNMGAFDDVDMAVMAHTSKIEEGKFSIGGTSNGHVVKYVRFIGKASHAGGSPHEGINALQASIVSLNALNTQRETFKNEDTIRLHGIMTKGGVSVSSIPAEIKYEGRVRGGTTAAIADANLKMDRCLRAGALALGCELEIITLPGYMPIKNNPHMSDIFISNAASLVGDDHVIQKSPTHNSGGSTDMGDLSQIMPVIHPYTGVATGTGHGDDYLVQDYTQGVVNPAKALAATIVDLLCREDNPANKILSEFQPDYSIKSYLKLQRSRLTEEVYKPK